MRQVFRLVLAALAALTFAGCSNIDCPLDNVVLAQAGLYSYETKQALKLTDSLTVTLPQTGMAVLNRATGIQSFLFPLKEGAGCDTLLCVSPTVRDSRPPTRSSSPIRPRPTSSRSTARPPCSTHSRACVPRATAWA